MSPISYFCVLAINLSSTLANIFCPYEVPPTRINKNNTTVVQVSGHHFFFLIIFGRRAYMRTQTNRQTDI